MCKGTCESFAHYAPLTRVIGSRSRVHLCLSTHVPEVFLSVYHVLMSALALAVCANERGIVVRLPRPAVLWLWWYGVTCGPLRCVCVPK